MQIWELCVAHFLRAVHVGRNSRRASRAGGVNESSSRIAIYMYVLCSYICVVTVDQAEPVGLTYVVGRLVELVDPFTICNLYKE